MICAGGYGELIGVGGVESNDMCWRIWRVNWSGWRSLMICAGGYGELIEWWSGI